MMARMIYVDELTEAISNQLEAHRINWNDSDMSMNYHNGMLFTLALTLSRPVVDAVPVVRCKDCKHYRNHPNGLCYLHTEPYDNRQGFKGETVCVDADDFCSYAERRNDGN